MLKATGEATVFKPMLPLLDNEMGKTAAIAPDNWANLIFPDMDYLARSQNVLLTRWNTWLGS